MSGWPHEGGATRIVSVDRNLRGILKRGGELAATALSKNEARELFPSLLVPGEKKLAKGASILEWPGGNPTTNAFEVAHGLGAEPEQVIGTSHSNACVVSCTVRSKTKFTLRVFNVAGSPAAGAQVAVDWIAFT
jgi:hypothetical protein